MHNGKVRCPQAQLHTDSKAQTGHAQESQVKGVDAVAGRRTSPAPVEEGHCRATPEVITKSKALSVILTTDSLVIDSF